MTFSVFALGFLVRPLGAMFFGYLGDSLGRRRALIVSIIVMSGPTFSAGIIGFIVLSYPIFWLLSQGSIETALAGELLFALTLSCIAPIIPTALAELFQVQTRNTGMALGYNISLAIFGGTAPLIAFTPKVMEPQLFFR